MATIGLRDFSVQGFISIRGAKDTGLDALLASNYENLNLFLDAGGFAQECQFSLKSLSKIPSSKNLSQEYKVQRSLNDLFSTHFRVEASLAGEKSINQIIIPYDGLNNSLGKVRSDQTVYLDLEYTLSLDKRDDYLKGDKEILPNIQANIVSFDCSSSYSIKLAQKATRYFLNQTNMFSLGINDENFLKKECYFTKKINSSCAIS